MINQQGRFNWSGLDAYAVKGSGLDLSEQFWENAVKELVGSRQSNGIIYGGVVSVVSALEVSITKGLCLFSNGTMVAWDAQDVTLTAADGANPRYDRIQLAYSLVDDQTDQNTLDETVVIDKIHVATASALAGVPDVAPVAPVRTANYLSLALIHVAAGQVTLNGGDIDQTEDSAFDLSYLRMGTAPYGIRFNHRLGLLQSTIDGTNWKAFGPGATKKITFADSPYTATSSQPDIEADTAGGVIVVNLPALASGFPVRVTKTSADGNAVNVTPSGAENLMGANALDALAVQYANKEYRPVTGSWVF